MIYMISTSACLPEEYDLRKQQYLDGLGAIREHYKLDPYIVESCGSDYYPDQLQFIGRNDYTSNKGVNEFANIQEFFKQYGHLFNNDDDIIKSTLRYQIISPHLLNLVRAGTQDIYLKSSADIYGEGDFGAHTFLMSMKYKCWKEFFNTCFNINSSDPIEWDVSRYAKSKGAIFVDKLDIIAVPWNHRPKTYTV